MASLTDEPARTEVTVLIVDDEPDVRRVAGIMLRRAGFTIVEAADGREAVEWLSSNPGTIDAVLLDIMMPVMGGHEAFAAIRGLDETLPVVFFSGYDRSEVAEQLEAGSAYTAFLPKPFTKADLISEIQQAVDARG